MGRDPHFALTQTAAPAAEPVEVADVLAHSRIDAADEDEALLEGLIKTARRWLEHYTGRQLITATWKLSLDRFPSGCPIRLPWAPLQSITSIVYTDQNGDSQTWSSADYQVDTDSQPGRVMPAYGEYYPTERSGILNAAAITYLAGYGTAKTDVPEDLRHVILLLVAHWYENREPVNIGNITSTLPFGVKALADSYRVQVFGGYV